MALVLIRIVHHGSLYDFDFGPGFAGRCNIDDMARAHQMVLALDNRLEQRAAADGPRILRNNTHFLEKTLLLRHGKIIDPIGRDLQLEFTGELAVDESGSAGVRFGRR
ncbi:hypothetical protein D3C80_1651420 [compost metagenome]